MAISRYMLGLSLLSLVVLGGGDANADADTTVSLNLGRVSGKIRFTDISPTAAIFLNSNAVVPNTSSDQSLRPMRLRVQGVTGAPAQPQTGDYIPQNQPLPQNGFLAAEYSVSPDLGDAPSANFLVESDSLKLSDGSLYRFGSPIYSSPVAVRCDNVLPLTVDPAGKQCDLQEQATLLKLKLSLTGPDVSGLSTTKPVTCVADAYVEDVPGSGFFNWQARSGRVISTVPAMTSGSGVDLLFLARKGGNLKIHVSCTATIRPGETGFVQTTDTAQNAPSDQTPLDKEISVPSGAAGETQATLEINVEKKAGNLQGHLDVSQLSEESSMIYIDNMWWNGISVPSVAASSLPSVPWVITGITEGPHSVFARALFNNGNNLLQFPQKGGLNGPVTIQRNRTTDIGPTFVSKPTQYSGTVVLRDRKTAGLTYLRNAPFPDTNIYGSTSFIEAHGVDRTLSSSADCWGLGAGTGAFSRAVLNGKYDPGTGRAVLDYKLLLTGLSPRLGNLDGSSSCPTPWDVDELFINSDTPTDTNAVTIHIGEVRNVTADPAALPITEPKPLDICFGKQKLSIRSSGVGTMSNAGLYLTATSLGRMEYPEQSYLTGASSQVGSKAAGASTAVSLTAMLPSPFQYYAFPSLNVTASGSSSSTWITPTPSPLPTHGNVRCGGDSGECWNLSGLDGATEHLSVHYASAAPTTCLETGDLSGTLTVASDGVHVDSVSYSIDGGVSSAVCASSCGPDPSYVIGGNPGATAINVGALSPGEHSITFTAQGRNGCQAHDSFPFTIPEPLSLICPAPLVLPLYMGQGRIYSSDYRITDGLEATVTGGCGTRAATCSPPPFFSTWQTTVTCSAGTAKCSTSVSLVPEESEALFYFEIDNSAANTYAAKIYNTHKRWTKVVASGLVDPKAKFSQYGEYIGIIQGGNINTFELYDSRNTERFVSLSLASTGRTVVDLALRPMENPPHNQETVLLTKDAAQNYYLELFNRTGSIASQKILSRHVGHAPLLEWSKDGRKLAVAYRAGMFSGLTAGIRVLIFDFGNASAVPKPVLVQKSERRSMAPIQSLKFNYANEILLASAPNIYKIDTANKITVLLSDRMLLVDISGGGQMASTPIYGAVYLNDTAGGDQIMEIQHLDPRQLPDFSFALKPGKSVSELKVSHYHTSFGIALPDRIELYEMPFTTVHTTKLWATVAAVRPRNILFQPFR